MILSRHSFCSQPGPRRFLKSQIKYGLRCRCARPNDCMEDIDCHKYYWNQIKLPISVAFSRSEKLMTQMNVLMI
uniref:Uncharacterized protein n=1 Tax=Solanum tuberosum TaxID=4113 RepID=M0ZJP8_SOLTU